MVERDAFTQLGVEILVQRKRQVYQADGEKCRGRRQGVDEILPIPLEGEVVEDAGVHQLLGVVAHLSLRQRNARFEPRRRQQFLIGILRIAFELDGLGREFLRECRQAGG